MRVTMLALVGLSASTLIAGPAEAEVIHALAVGEIKTSAGNSLGTDRSEERFLEEGRTHAAAGESMSSAFGGSTANASGWGRSWINPSTGLLSLQASASQGTNPEAGGGAYGYAMGAAVWEDTLYVPRVEDVLLTFQVTADLFATGSGQGRLSAGAGPVTADFFFQSDGEGSGYGWDSYSWDAVSGKFSGLVTFRYSTSPIDIDGQEWGYGKFEVSLLGESFTETGSLHLGGSSRVESLNSMTLIRVAYADSGLPPEAAGEIVRFESGLRSPKAVPEPSSLMLASLGGLGLLSWRFGRRRGLGVR